jgi:hypothetical protein
MFVDVLEGHVADCWENPLVQSRFDAEVSLTYRWLDSHVPLSSLMPV